MKDIILGVIIGLVSYKIIDELSMIIMGRILTKAYKEHMKEQKDEQ